MSRYQSSPDQPPFPIPMNLWFQPEAGIHTSNLMLESFVGLISPATRQKAGRLPKGGPGKCNSTPAGSSFARTMVVSGNASVARLSHVAARAAHAAEKTANDATKALNGTPRSVILAISVNSSPLCLRSLSRDSPIVHSRQETITKDRGAWLPPTQVSRFATLLFNHSSRILVLTNSPPHSSS